MVNEISIIIPTLNEEKYIGRLLTLISKQTYIGKLQVIIVDGKSIDNTISKIKEYDSIFSDLEIIISKKRNISYQRNIGVERAKYKYLLFLDADVKFDQNFIHNLAKKVKPNERFIDICNTWITDADILSVIIGFFVYPIVILIILMGKITSGYILFTTKENHNNIHGFREGLTYGEDTDYGHRSISDGAKFHFHFHPIIRYSLRRAKKLGRIGILLFNLRSYRDIKKNGVDEVNHKVYYPYGKH